MGYIGITKGGRGMLGLWYIHGINILLTKSKKKISGTVTLGKMNLNASLDADVEK